jgi:hypothetical protein
MFLLITVTLHDGTTVLTAVVVTGPESDLAVAEVDLPTHRSRSVRFADSTGSFGRHRLCHSIHRCAGSAVTAY